MTISLGSRAASAGYKLATFDETGSTNTEAMLAARAGEQGPMWFVTTLQTAGRGRRQRAAGRSASTVSGNVFASTFAYHFTIAPSGPITHATRRATFADGSSAAP